MKKTLFHPTTLKLLYEWKTSSDQDVWLDLVALLVDCEKKLDYNELDSIFYEYKEVQKKKGTRIKELKAVVESKFVIGHVSQKQVACEDMVYLLCDISEVRDEVAALLVSIRKSQREMEEREKNMSLLFSKGEEVMRRNTKEQNVSILKFARIEDRKEKTCSAKIGVFDPVCFDNSTVVSTFLRPARNTMRIRKGLQNPRRLIFVKFCNETRLPIRRPRTERLNIRNSLSRLPQVLDYDYDSDPEDNEDAETVHSSDTEEQENEEGDLQLIESSTDDNPGQTYQTYDKRKRPFLAFPQCKFSIFAQCPHSWLSLPLVERDIFPEEYLEEFRSGLEATEHIQMFSRKFGRQYMIAATAINRKLLELGFQAVPHPQLEK